MTKFSRPHGRLVRVASRRRPVTTDRLTRPWHLYLLTVLGVVLLVLALTEIGPPASSARTSTQIVTAQNGVVQSTVTGSGTSGNGTTATNTGTTG
jgi:hypothetical protein